MSAPAWFDKDVYLDNKLAQLQADEPNNGWDELKMAEAFNNAGFNPFTADGVYAHFVAYGNAENVSPNAYFDVDTYFANKLAQLQATEPDKGWTSVDQVKEAFADAGLSAWDHYTLYGTAEGISPSAGFNTEDYMNAKLAQMQADDPAYTMEQLEQAFKDADLNPIEHYLLYGKNENLSYTPSAAAEYAPLPEEGLTVAKATTDLAAGTIKAGEFYLQDTVDALDGATYSLISNAKGVYVEDTVAALTASNAANVLAKAEHVIVADDLVNLVTATLPDFGGTPTSLLVTKVSSAVNMGQVTVAVAADAQNMLDAFLARTDVYYDKGVTKPQSLELDAYAIKDTAANVAAADATLLKNAESLTVSDTVAELGANLSLIEDDLNTNMIVNVDDSLSNIANANQTIMKGLAEQFSGSGQFTLTATDEGSVDLTLTKTLDFLASDSHAIDVSDASAINLSAGKDAADIILNDLFSTDGDTTFSFTGSDNADTIAAHNNGGTINGGKGFDTITLGTEGAGVDTVVLGAGEASDYTGTIGTGAVGGDSIANFGSAGDDLLTFDNSGFLSWANDATIETMASTVATAANDAFEDNSFVVLTGNVTTAAASIAALFVSSADATTGFALNKGDDMVLVTASGSSSYIWYISQLDDDVTIDAAKEVKLIATVNAVLTADDFAQNA